MTQSKNRCHYCGERGGATTDHIVPMALGGPASDPRNFVRACLKCNNQKAATMTDCYCRTCAAAVALFAPRQHMLDYSRRLCAWLETMNRAHNDHQPGLHVVASGTPSGTL